MKNQIQPNEEALNAFLETYCDRSQLDEATDGELRAALATCISSEHAMEQLRAMDENWVYDTCYELVEALDCLYTANGLGGDNIHYVDNGGMDEDGMYDRGSDNIDDILEPATTAVTRIKIDELSEAIAELCRQAHEYLDHELDEYLQWVADGCRPDW